MMDPPILAFVFLVGIILLSVVLAYKRPKTGRLLCGFWTFFSLAGLFSPAIWTIAWHVKHGDHIQFGEMNIRVPFRWVASEIQTGGVVDDGMELSALHLNIVSAVLNHGWPVGSIMLGPRVVFSSIATPDERLKYWQAVYSRIHSEPDDIVTGPMRLNSSSQLVICMETVDNAVPKKASASCLFPETGWAADFGGSLKSVDSFFDVVRSVSPVESRSR
jgi:hypothetical protein